MLMCACDILTCKHFLITNNNEESFLPTFPLFMFSERKGRKKEKTFFLFTFAIASSFSFNVQCFLSTKQQEVSIHSFIVHICISFSLLLHNVVSPFFSTLQSFCCVCVCLCFVYSLASSWRLISFRRAIQTYFHI